MLHVDQVALTTTAVIAFGKKDFTTVAAGQPVLVIGRTAMGGYYFRDMNSADEGVATAEELTLAIVQVCLRSSISSRPCIKFTAPTVSKLRQELISFFVKNFLFSYAEFVSGQAEDRSEDLWLISFSGSSDPVPSCICTAVLPAKAEEGRYFESPTAVFSYVENIILNSAMKAAQWVAAE